MRTSLIIAALVLLIAPTSVGAEITVQDIENNISGGAGTYNYQGFSNDGVYGCGGSVNNSIGKEVASGPFVPVSDDAISHNTNVLVYKECVLDGIANRVKESMVAFMEKASFKWINEGYNGEPAFVTNQADFRQQVGDKVVAEFTQGEGTANICAPFKRDVQETLQRTYAQATRQPQSIYSCTVPDEQMDEYEAFIQGNAPFSWDMFLQAVQPQNNALGISALSLNQMVSKISEKVSDEYRELDWGNGYKSAKSCKQVPAGNGTYEEHCEITTPGQNIVSLVNNLSQTPLDMTKNADEIDELMGSLMSNLHTQILTSLGGLRGITESTSGAASYLDQIANDSASRTRTEYTSAGTGYLTGAIAVETAYKTAREGSRTTLESAATRLTAKEGACWDGLIAQAKADLITQAEATACARITAGTSTNCGIQGSATVTYSHNGSVYDDTATSTRPSEYDIVITATAGSSVETATLHHTSTYVMSAISNNVTPLLTAVNQSIDSASRALAVLLGLQTSLAGSNSTGNTRFVLEQVDQLAAAGVLHSEGDVSQAQSQSGQISEAMQQMVQETTTTWDAGWCKPTSWRDQIK